MNAWGTNNVTQTISFTSFDTLIWSMTVMNLTELEQPASVDADSAIMSMFNLTRREEPSNNDHSVSATECGLWYCVNSYQSTVRNGILSEIIQRTASKRDPGSWQPIRSDSAKGGFKRIILPRYLNIPSVRATDLFTRIINSFAANSIVRRTDLQIGDFNISQAAALSLVDLLRETLTDSTYSTNQTDPIRNLTLPLSPGFNYTSIIQSDHVRYPNAVVLKDVTSKGPGGYGPPAMENLYHSQDLEATFANLAKSITNNIRQISNSDNHTVINGKEGRYVVLIRIRPWFLILPVILIFGGVLFFVLVLHHTRKSRIEIWGTNTLPIVNLGRKMESIFDDNDMKISTMTQKAKQHFVQLPTFQSPRRDFDGVDTIIRSETHEMITPSSISADGTVIASPSRTSSIVQSSSPDALSPVSDYDDQQKEIGMLNRCSFFLFSFRVLLDRRQI